MMALRLLFATLALLSAHTFCRSAEVEDQTCFEDGTCKDIPSQCSLFVAPSTIPNAGLGVFTAVPIMEHETIGHGDLILPLLELEFHQGMDEFFHPFQDYMWDSYAFGMQMESDVPSFVNAFAPGLDALMNSHAALYNVKRDDFEYDDEVGGHRSASPSCGSMTPYHDERWIATTDIPAGAELFRYYGDEWFESRPEYDTVPLVNDYIVAERLIKTLHDDENKTPDEIYSILNGLNLTTRTMNAVPRDPADIKIIAERSIQELLQPNATKPLDELATIGRCLDASEHGESTIEGAGRGAFATRAIREGTVVTGSPVIVVPDDELADMYGSIYDEEEEATVRDVDDFAGYQLWYNYCLSHPNTTLLLCPYGSGVGYINHDKELINVKLQWAPHGQMGQNETWFLKTPEEMQDTTVQLGIDYVATRDIEEGEELFLDYGSEWEEAWEEHVEEWEPDDFDYISATQWNQQHQHKMLLTHSEQSANRGLNRYPENLEIRCHPLVLKDPSEKATERSDELWPSWQKGHACQIHSRTVTENGEYLYTVFVFDEDENEAVIRRDVKREMIAMIDTPFSTDLHMIGNFRYYIGIPNDMMPQAWLGR